MGASGTAILDFGSFPGQSTASLVVASAGITPTSLIEAWILPAVTTDHSADEHQVETLTVKADQTSVVPGVSFVINLTNTSQLNEPLVASGSQGSTLGGLGTRIFGKWSIGWVWV
jgi:L-fucose mutarotase/ribose pyranase (RbsD/FucU family)